MAANEVQSVAIQLPYDEIMKLSTSFFLRMLRILGTEIFSRKFCPYNGSDITFWQGLYVDTARVCAYACARARAEDEMLRLYHKLVRPFLHSPQP